MHCDAMARMKSKNGKRSGLSAIAGLAVAEKPTSATLLFNSIGGVRGLETVEVIGDSTMARPDQGRHNRGGQSEPEYFGTVELWRMGQDTESC